MGETMIVEGATNSVVFETYIEKVLAPSLLPGQIVILDNLSAQESEGQRACGGKRGKAVVSTCLLA